MLQLLGIFSGAISVLGYIPYLKDIFRGKTKPERAAWLIWTVLGSIAFFSQLAKGATDSLWMTGVQAVGVLVIFILSLRFGTGGFTMRDGFALLFATFGLILWYFTKEATIVLLIVICIDAVGTLLTVVKGYENPSSETFSSWIFFAASGIAAMLAVGDWNLILLAYPLYIVFANVAVVTAIYLGNKKLSKI